MPIWFIFSLLFSLIVAFFAVMNSDIVTIRLYWVNYQLSESLVILISAIFGGIIAFLFGTVNKVKSSLKIRELNKEIKNLEQKINVPSKTLIEPKVKDYDDLGNDSERPIKEVQSDHLPT